MSQTQTTQKVTENVAGENETELFCGQAIKAIRANYDQLRQTSARQFQAVHTNDVRFRDLAVRPNSFDVKTVH